MYNFTKKVFPQKICEEIIAQFPTCKIAPVGNLMVDGGSKVICRSDEGIDSATFDTVSGYTAAIIIYEASPTDNEMSTIVVNHDYDTAEAEAIEDTKHVKKAMPPILQHTITGLLNYINEQTGGTETLDDFDTRVRNLFDA